MMERPQKISYKNWKLWAMGLIQLNLVMTTALRSMKTSQLSRLIMDLAQRIIDLNWIMSLSFLRVLNTTTHFRGNNSIYLMPLILRAWWKKTIMTSDTSRFNTSPKWLTVCINLLLISLITKKILSRSMFLGLVQAITQGSTLNFWKIWGRIKHDVVNKTLSNEYIESSHK